MPKRPSKVYEGFTPASNARWMLIPIAAVLVSFGLIYGLASIGEPQSVWVVNLLRHG